MFLITENSIRQFKQPIGSQSNRELEKPKRVMPINPKNKVFNEWAAVLKHQDEMNQEAEKIMKVKQKKQQQEYRQQLQTQLNYQNKKYCQQFSKLMDYDSNRVCEEQAKIEQQIVNEQKDIAKKRTQNNEVVKESMMLARMNKESIKLTKLKEDEAVIDKYKKDDRIERDRVSTQRQIQISAQTDMVQQNQHLIKIKRDQIENAKYMEKQVIVDEQIKMDKEHNERARYFDNLKRYQNDREQREQHFKDYVQADWSQLSKRDERGHQQKVNQMEARAIQDEINADNKKYQMKIEQQKGLEMQVNMKIQTQQRQKDNEKAFAQIAIIKDDQDRRQQQSERDLIKSKRNQYQQELNVQAKDTRKRKRYDGLMTEYEKQVNQQEISAFEDGNKLLNSKMIGFQDPNLGQNAGIRRSKQKGVIQTKSVVDLNHGCEIFQERSLTSIQTPATNVNGSMIYHGGNLQNKILDVPQELINKANKRMTKPEAEAYRPGTYGRGYGVKKTVSSSVIVENNPYAQKKVETIPTKPPLVQSLKQNQPIANPEEPEAPKPIQMIKKKSSELNRSSMGMAGKVIVKEISPFDVKSRMQNACFGNQLSQPLYGRANVPAGKLHEGKRFNILTGEVM